MQRSDHRIFVHVGLPKTATTALQQDVFPLLPGVTYLGFKGTRIADPALRAAAEMIVAALKFAAREIVEAPVLHPRLAQAVDAVARLRGPVLLSEESLATSANQLDYDRVPLVPRALRRLFGRRAAAIVVLREPVAFVASLLQQKMWTRPHAGRAIRSDGRWPRPRDIIDLHLDRSARGDPRFIFTSACRYDRILGWYRGTLGADACHVLAYEALFDERRLYRTAFAAILGTPPTDAVAGRENESSDAKRTEMARHFLGAEADPARIAEFAAAWSDVRSVVAADDRLTAYLARHCAAPYLAALRGMGIDRD
ncbi:MAG: hypothetical protein IT561_09930 [Alphaproteobacteria bacterium]|nr:hypothetical protein [Alphaproteobacteria bacterium]